MRNQLLIAPLLLLSPMLAAAQQTEKVDLNVIHRIKSEALGRGSKVMDHLFYMTDVNGPRLTDSKGHRMAAEWAVQRLKDYGLSNVHLEKWGPFGKAWNLEYYSGHMIAPQYQTIIAYPVAWTPGTNGVVSGEPILLPTTQTQAEMEAFKGKLAGKIVLISEKPVLQMIANPLGVRYSESELNDLTNVQIQIPGLAGGGRGARGGGGRGGQTTGAPSAQAIQTFLKAEKPALVIQASTRGDGGTLFGGGQSRNNNDNLPTVMMAAEHYNRIARLLEHKLPVTLQFEIKASFDENPDSFNVIAELPGNAKKDEVVMVGGHFDSWHYGTGATDNAAGSAIAMEVMRVLKTLDLKQDRTVRLALWSGEEQGLLGSRAYVKEHFADPATMKTTTEHEKFAGYFNIDNGTGKIRGIYLQGNEMAGPIFEQWLKPFRDLGATTVTNRNTTGTDHVAFDNVGLPGFQFIQDAIEYNTRTHHSNMDVYDRIQAADLMQMSAIESSFVYLAAARPEKLPRKPLPPPTPAGRGGRGGTDGGGGRGQ